MTKDDISSAIKTARQGYDFLKIEMYNHIFLQVFFERDYKCYIKTNSRDLMLWNEIMAIEAVAYRPTVLENFLFRWITKLST